MRKQFLILPLFLMSAAMLPARTLTPAEALRRISDQPVTRSSVDADPVMTIESDQIPTLYIFNQSESGWMILSADDVAAPLIGYSRTGSFDPENIPENLSGWLDMCSSQIAQASAVNALPYSREVSQASEKEPIEPMLKTLWNQDAPYNRYCPGGNTYTGCVATAMAQVMKYYNWPLKAGENAKFSYTWDSKTLTADFSNYEFDWDNMLDEYSGNAGITGDAVAKLMQACGYSLHMRYSTTASAAYSEFVGNALVTYFDYDKGLHNEFRNLYPSAEWENMIYDNLKDVGPMVYWGGAHCFVCDGYDGNGYFHFNWGWSGAGDGYFLLTSLRPTAVGIGGANGDYTLNQGALFGIKPSDGSDSPLRYTFRIDELTDAYQGSLGFRLNGSFVNSSPYSVNGQFIYQIYSWDGSTKIMSCPVESPLCKNWGIDIETGNTNLVGFMQGSLKAVPDGTYRLYPAVEVDGVEYRFQCPPTIVGYVTITCRDGQATSVQIPSAGELTVSDVNSNGDYYLNSYIKVSGVARFTGWGDTNHPVYAVLVDSNGYIRAYSTTQKTLHFTAEGEPFEFVVPWFYDKGRAIEPGNYTLGVARSENGSFKILGSCPVKVNARVLRATLKTPINLSVENADAVDPEDIRIVAEVECSSGSVYQDAIFTIYKAGKVVRQERVPMYASTGYVSKLTFNTTLPDAAPGDDYYVYVTRDNAGRSEYISGKVDFKIMGTSGVTPVESDDDTPAEYFNLQGIRVDNANLTPGVYICRQGYKVTRVLVR